MPVRSRGVAIEAGEQKNIISVFKKIAEAVKAGELDDIIAGVAKFGTSVK